MRWIDKLANRTRFSIPNLMIYVTATMLAVYVIHTILLSSGQYFYNYLYFSRADIFSGQVWRLITFLFMPNSTSPLWLIISLYFYYMIGRTLEYAWGSTKFTLYYLFGVVFTIIGGLLVGYATNSYLNLSLFFAYAVLFPDQEFLVFFVIPVKAKYLAWINAALFLYQLISGSAYIRVSILFSLLNFILFFGGDLIRYGKNRYDTYQRRKNYRNNGGW